MYHILHSIGIKIRNIQNKIPLKLCVKNNSTRIYNFYITLFVCNKLPKPADMQYNTSIISGETTGNIFNA